MKRLLHIVVVVVFGVITNFWSLAEPRHPYLSPTALVATPDGKILIIACATANQLLFYDLASRKVSDRLDLPASPSGLALTRDGERLYVTCAATESIIAEIDVARHQIIKKQAAGHTAMCPILSPDEKRLYVCNRFNNDVSILELPSLREVKRVPVSREPVAAAVIQDGTRLLVANHFHNVITDGGGVAAMVSVIDTDRGSVIKKIQLPRGSSSLRGIAVSPNGRFAAVVHLVARYYLPTRDLESGRINANALSLLDLEKMEMARFTYLDFEEQGAANPWDVGWTADGKYLVVSHAGTHEISILEGPQLRQQSLRIRQRLQLGGIGPRGLAFVGTTAYIANYFSENISRVELAAAKPVDKPLELAPPLSLSKARRGEMLFNEGRLSQKGWQSCASCHDSDARMDGLNWDLLNDGQGNPKNAKSLVWSHVTPPAMWMGVRDTAETGVRAGIRHILFTDQPEEVAEAIDEYLKTLGPIPSPRLVNGKLSPAAERGHELFFSHELGCARCHPVPYYTDRKKHDVGTKGRFDRPGESRFDTPTLVELWRTGPYLHDGSVSTFQQMFTRRNPDDLHGKTSHLNSQQINDLAEFLLSL